MKYSEKERREGEGSTRERNVHETIGDGKCRDGKNRDGKCEGARYTAIRNGSGNQSVMTPGSDMEVRLCIVPDLRLD